MSAEMKDFNIKVNEIYYKNNNLPKGDYVIKPVYSKEAKYLDNNNYSLRIRVDIGSLEARDAPITIKVDLEGIFTLIGDKEEIDMFLNTRAVQFVYPHVRALVANITASAMVPSLLLPIVYPDDFKNVK